ncbi:hypothetical protein BWZ22_04875 [Seonamhaeicola sp. S2-3]|uniref:DUF1853 family protein n=1 Tax=Seonamhaeicola sp. S2-3 TaxID=1936081 RepID=UPI000972BF8C|nr:DUF1853 family protein [Seonamhaeicola sp. S2-3]APY10611.1 hypothetical protein BWZ22_04875 [Seonamhaeicola sp. S2-3]
MLQKRYEGFLKTPVLWQNNVVLNLQQFEIETTTNNININVDDKLRLGKYIERFVSFELQQQNNISILAENIQIQQNKITLGELDCLILKNDTPIHLEIIYKFYLYDETVGNTETDHFIGPNRKDSLIEKLIKLKEKQLPLLHSEACKPYLDNLGLNAKTISQQVYFKAQLFLPYNNQNIQLKTLNNQCISGYYISINTIINFKDCKFFIPNKKDWLITPHPNVAWLNFVTFSSLALEYLDQKYSTLFWLKFKNGIIKKMFLVWW